VADQDNRVRSLAYFALAGGCQSMEDYTRAVDAYQMAIQHGRAAENPVAEMMSTSSLALMVYEHGQLHLACEIAAPVCARLEQAGALPPTSAGLYGLLGEVHYQWGHFAQARSHILRAVQLCTLGGYNTVEASHRVSLSRLFQTEGDLEAATSELRNAIDLVPVEAPGYFLHRLVAQKVSIHLAQNIPAAAEMALQGQGFSFQGQFSYPELPPGQSIPYSVGLLYNSSLRVLLFKAQAGGDPARLRPGIDLAGRLIAGALQSQHILVALETILLRAQMHAALGSSSASQADYVRALELSEPEGFIAVFVEKGPPVAKALANLLKQDQLGATRTNYIERILTAFSNLQSSRTVRDEPPASSLLVGTGMAALVEPLTDRELEVLHLIAEGLKYREIASKLFISMNTVRFHVKAIYGKLGVNNRTQAIRKARQLRIL
jgi:LuxR family maltose regulon positive regulatory protein